MNKPKVLHVSTARSWRGGEQQIAYLVTELARNNWDQAIVCIKDAPLHKWAQEQGIPVLGLKKRSSVDLSFAYRLQKFAASQKVSHLHAHDAHAHGFAVYAKAFFGGTQKLVVSRRVDFPVAGSLLSRFKYNHQAVDKYLAVSDAIAEILRKSIQDPQKVFTVHSAVNPHKIEQSRPGFYRQKYSEWASKFWVGNVAALVDHKDQATFLKTAASLLEEDKNYHFFIAGSGELEQDLKQLSRELGIEEAVSFLGFINDPGQLLKDLDCFLFTSKMEGLGTSVLDAFAAQVPVVASKAGGIPEMVEHEKSGLLADIGDVEGFTKAVARIKKETKLSEDLIQEAKSRLKAFSPQELAKATISHYLN